MTDILIPKERLSEGFESCHKQISTMLSDSKKLFESRKFISSIGLSILAHEEIGKLNIIRNHIFSKTDISKSDWDNISKPGSHAYKLTIFYGYAFEDLKKMGEERYNTIVEAEKQRTGITSSKYSELLKSESMIRERLKKLNDIKKSCLYVDWKNNDWFSISKIYSEHELDLLANYLLEFATYELISELIVLKFPLDYYYEVIPEKSIMRNDPLWKQREEYSKRVYEDKDYGEF